MSGKGCVLWLWHSLDPLPLGVWEGLRFVIVALPELFSYLLFQLHGIRTLALCFHSGKRKYLFGPLGGLILITGHLCVIKKGKRKVQRVPHSQTAALPRVHEGRKQTKPNKRKFNKCTKSNKISSLFPKRGNRNAKRTEKHKNKIIQGKT